ITELVFKSPELSKRILIAQPSDADTARKVIQNFASRAFRRPLRDGEVEKYVRLVEMSKKNGDSFETGIQLAVQAILVSPHFLFRIEFDGRPNDPSIRTLNDFELATRLSYFLWSSMPDEELFGLARKGELRKSNHLEAQIRRMLKDAKSRALVENFAGQW